MKTLCALPLLLLLSSFQSGAEELVGCDGCDDSSPTPIPQVTSQGACTAFTTIELWQNDGLCFGFGELCVNAPCSPFIRIRNHTAKNKRVVLEGVLGKSNIGPLSYASGQDMLLLQNWTEVGCGAESAFYFYVTTECAGPDMVEYIGGAFVCTPCLPQR